MWALGSMKEKNKADKFSMDEAISINIITNALQTRLFVHYEYNIQNHRGMPDCIITLGNNLHIFVSTTRGFRIKWCHMNKGFVSVFDYTEAHRLLTKKLTGLSNCVMAAKYFIDDIYSDSKRVCSKKYCVRPILHVLVPSNINAKILLDTYENILQENEIKYLNKILLIISVVEADIY
jgi:hypothetical protein